jgi:hypothetical protein
MANEYTGKRLYLLQLEEGQPTIKLTFSRAMIDAPDVMWKGECTPYFECQLDQLRDTIKDFILLHYQRYPSSETERP